MFTWNWVSCRTDSIHLLPLKRYVCEVGRRLPPGVTAKDGLIAMLLIWVGGPTHTPSSDRCRIRGFGE